MSARRVVIVFEIPEGAPDAQGRFNVFVEGAERTKGLPESDWSSAEFWALKCFAICGEAIKNAGAFSHVEAKPTPS